MRILIATDGSECSDAAAAEVARRPWPEGSQVRIITVTEPLQPFMAEPWAMSKDDDTIEKALADRGQAIVARTAEILQGVGLDVSTAVLHGSPKHTILEDAERWRADLIVFGSHGRRGLERFLLGSVAQAVALHAPCSVEIVRHAACAATRPAA